MDTVYGATGTVERERVEAVWTDPVLPLVAVDLLDGSTIKVTSDHPFSVDASAVRGAAGWVAAGALRPGDRLRTASGHDATVTGVRYHVGQAVVYTLTVAKDHTFFVGTARVLVHNATCPVGIKITAKGLIHLIYRHLNSSDLARALLAKGKVGANDIASTSPAGQFFAGTTSGELRNLIVEAFNEGNRVAAYQLQGSRYVAEIKLTKNVGRTIAGQSTSIVRLVVAGDGTLITIYPLG